MGSHRRSILALIAVVATLVGVCAVPAAAIVGEAMVAITLANVLLEKFGSDNMSELLGSMEAYLKTVQ
jgi:chorismate synthase